MFFSLPKSLHNDLIQTQPKAVVFPFEVELVVLFEFCCVYVKFVSLIFVGEKISRGLLCIISFFMEGFMLLFFDAYFLVHILRSRNLGCKLKSNFYL